MTPGNWKFALQETLETAGAKVSDDGVVETFDNDDEALDAAYNGVVVGFYFSIFFLYSFSFYCFHFIFSQIEWLMFVLYIMLFWVWY